MKKYALKDISIIIPNYNGRKLLEQNLPSLVKNAAGAGEIIVVDDGSTDGSARFIQETYPSIKTVILDKNNGFSFAVNAGVREAAGGIVYVLNSDVEVLSGFLEPVIPHFGRDDVFAVGSAENGAGSAVCGIPFVRFKYGIFWYWYGAMAKASCEVHWVSGGHTAYDKKKFLSLGGFDTIFRPFYAEDGDICWRAWKRGWRSILEQKSAVRHKTGGTIGRFYSRSEIGAIHWKNRFLMTWKILSSRWLIFKHIFFLPAEAALLPFFGKKEFSIGFLKALRQLPEVLSARRNAPLEKEKYSDRQLFNRFSRKPKFPPFNILYIHESSGIGGAENSLLNLAGKIDKRIFNPLFILPEEGPFGRKLESAGIDAQFVVMPRLRGISGIAASLKKLRDVTKEKKIDLIHTNGVRSNMYGAIVSRMEGIPIIWHERNLITGETIDTDRVFYFLPDTIICNSKAIARRFGRIERLPRKVKVIYNGVDLERFNPAIKAEAVRRELGIGEDTSVVGIASRFSEDKGHEYFLSEAKLIKEAFDNGPDISHKKRIKFLVIGGEVFKEEAGREERLRKLAGGLGLKEDVIFSGFRDDTEKLFRAMDIAVLTSRAEPCGRVLIEAMASGIPVVATASGGTPEIVADGTSGILFKPFERGALSGAVVRLLTDPRAARAMGREGRLRAEENFSIGKNVSAIEEEYMRLLRPRNYQVFL